jgi:hypothetical protein
MTQIKEGDWVRLKDIGSVGVVEKFLPTGELMIRIPSITDWPFPQWEMVEPKAVMKTRAPRKPKDKPVFEEALL